MKLVCCLLITVILCKSSFIVVFIVLIYSSGVFSHRNFADSSCAGAVETVNVYLQNYCFAESSSNVSYLYTDTELKTFNGSDCKSVSEVEASALSSVCSGNNDDAGFQLSSIWLSYQVTEAPTVSPTVFPTVRPTELPTLLPSLMPTTIGPSVTPTAAPSVLPSQAPSVAPTVNPSVIPTVAPTRAPSTLPTVGPSVKPTVAPSVLPTVGPTVKPTVIPTVSPSVAPSVLPTVSPSVVPSLLPSVTPTSLPPSVLPTLTPSVQPTQPPSLGPTAAPSIAPTSGPSLGPSTLPSTQPSVGPTVDPSVLPTVSPTQTPTARPSAAPTERPSVGPTVLPSTGPSRGPTVGPTIGPTVIPSIDPSALPSVIPTLAPSHNPTVSPTTRNPTMSPTTSAPIYSVAPTYSFAPSVEPSIAPSFSPTRSPTDVSTVPPKVSNIHVLSSDDSSMTVSLGFEVANVYDGTVYCAAIADEDESDDDGAGTDDGRRRLASSSVSISQILSSATPVSYSAGSLYVNATVSGLDPSSTYSLYAYAVSSAGYGTSLDDIQQSGNKGIRTSCCKKLTFKNIPVNVYGDVSKYANAPNSNYLFSFALSAAPKSKMIITPIVRNANGSIVTEVSAVPAKFTFAAKRRVLTGSFYLSAAATLAGTYTVQLNMSEASLASDFKTDVVKATVNILRSSTPLPGPSLAFSVFSASGACVFFGFDSPTDYAGITDTFWNCSELYQFTGSDNSNCSWVNSTVTKVDLPKYSSGSPLLQQNDPIVVKPNKIRSSCASNCSFYPYSDSSTAVTAFSANPVVPNPVVNMPSSVSGCSDLVIDATLSSGGGSRQWNATVWTVAGVDSGDLSSVDTSYILAQLNLYDIVMTKITIDSSLLQEATYTFTLTLTNFQGNSASTTAVVQVVGNVNQPELSISGLNTVTVNPSQSVTVFSSGTVAACSSNTEISYEWAVYFSGQNVGLSSLSNDPSVLILPSYSLSVGNVYQARLSATVASKDARYSDGEATTQVSIVVVNGAVVAVVKGGYYRAVSITEDSPLLLDAGSSYDENVDPSNQTSALTYSWDCVLSSNIGFGNNCTSVFGGANLTQSSMTLHSENVNASLTYDISVEVTAADGRFGSAVVTVQNLYFPEAAATAPYTYVSTVEAKFNADSAFTLHGVVQGAYMVAADWTAFVSNAAVSVTSLTTSPFNFTESDVESEISFPLSFPANTFTPGSQITFRLTAQKADQPDLYSYSMVTLTVNSPPSGGSISASPTSGVPLTTVFQMTALGWTDDSTDYPLTFDFSYALSTDYVTIKTRSSSSSASSTLPSGLQSALYAVTLRTGVYDNLLACANSYSSVAVQANTSEPFNITAYIYNNLNIAYTTSDLDLMLQVVANGANTLNAVNCSLANETYCALLNREQCSSVSQTCSECLPGYIGIPGSSNVRCLNASQPVAATCTSDDECIYGFCDYGVCAVPPKKCISTFTGVECSDTGYCQYTDPSNNIISNCTIDDAYCYAMCICDAGYGGADCSLSVGDRDNLNNLRTELCTALQNILDIADPTPLLVQTLITDLYLTYDPSEVTTGLVTCHLVLSEIAALAADGFLIGSDYSFGSYLVTAASLFFQANVTAVINLSGTLRNITKGLLLNMANGQEKMHYDSPNFKLTLVRDAISHLSYAPYTPPSDAIPPSISFTNDSVSACDDGFGYAKLGVIGFGLNPYPNSYRVTTPIFRTQSHAHTVVASRELSAAEITNPANFTPAFYFTLQFSRKQEFDFSLDPNSIRAKTSNITFPFCRLYDGSKYVPCDSCNITSYTDYNVTYGCTNINQICDAPEDGIGGGRRLTLEEEDSVRWYYESIALGRDPTVEYLSRKLFTLSGDDDGSSTDYGSGTVSQFGSITTNLLKEVDLVFSVNIFAINPKEAIPILVFVGTLFFCFLAGMIFFARWDRFDHHVLIYTKDSKLQREIDKAREVLNEYERFDEYYRVKRKSRNALVKYFSSLKKSNVANLNESIKIHRKSSFLLEQEAPDYDVVTAEVNDYLNFVMPMDLDVLNSKRMGFFTALWTQHDYLSMMTFPSVSTPRLVRWTNFAVTLLISLFVDSLFFGQFYVNRGECEAHANDEAGCTSLYNSASNQATCVWTPSTDVNAASTAGSCEMLPPPASAVFTMIILTITTIVAVPVTLLYDYLLGEVCAKRPAFEEIGINSAMLLNTESHKMLSGTHDKEAELGKLLREAEEALHFDLTYDSLNNPVGDNAAIKMQLHQINESAHRIYHNTVSTNEEVDQIYSEVADFFAHYSQNVEMPWKATASSYASQRATAHAIADYCNIDIGGRTIHLSLRQYLLYGNARNRLMTKIRQIRKRTAHIKDALEVVGDVGSLERDVALIQYFILEQFVAYKRYVLQHHFFLFNESTPPKIHPIKWILCWMFLFLSSVFFLYWILSWAILNGSLTFRSWGINFCLSVIQDVFFLQLAKIYVLYVLAMHTIRPQLNSIYRTLNKLALDFTQEDAATRAANQNSTEIRVVQHMSPACRAARFNASNGLAATSILHQMKDIDWQVCKLNHTKVSYLVFFLLVFPGALSIIHILVGEKFLETILPLFVSTFVIANYLVSVRSLGGLVAIYVVIGLFLLWKFKFVGALQLRIRKIIELSKYGGFDPQKQTRSAWVTAKRAQHKQTLSKFVHFCVHSTSVAMYRLSRRVLAPFVEWKKAAVKKQKKKLAWKNMNLYVTSAQIPNCHDVVTPKNTRCRLSSRVTSMGKSMYQQSINGENAMSSRSLRRPSSPTAMSMYSKSPSSASRYNLSPKLSLSSPTSPGSTSSYGLTPTASNKNLHDVWQTSHLMAYGDKIKTTHIMANLPPEIVAMKSNVDSWHPEKSSPYVSGYITRLLEKHLFHFDDNRSQGMSLDLIASERSFVHRLESMSNINISKMQKIQRRHEHDKASTQYRNKNSVCTDPQEALARMLYKSLGVSTSITYDGVSIDPDVEVYWTTDDYLHYRGKVTVEFLVSIVRDVFDIYQVHSDPEQQLSEEEREEINAMFTSWLAQYNLGEKDEIEFERFRPWFVATSAHIRRCTASYGSERQLASSSAPWEQRTSQDRSSSELWLQYTAGDGDEEEEEGSDLGVPIIGGGWSVARTPISRGESMNWGKVFFDVNF